LEKRRKSRRNALNQEKFVRICGKEKDTYIILGERRGGSPCGFDEGRGEAFSIGEGSLAPKIISTRKKERRYEEREERKGGRASTSLLGKRKGALLLVGEKEKGAERWL